MGRRTRRAMLAGAAALVGAAAGCSGLRHALEGRPSVTPETDRDGPPPTDTVERTLVLEAVEPPSATGGGEPPDVTVYPESMGLWLRRAAATGETVRGHARAFVVTPVPFWTRYGTVRLAGPDSAGAEGVYEMTAEGGTRYELLVGATETPSPPADAEVTPVSALSETRRDLALSVIRGERVTLYPETELGEWVRTEWFGGYVEHEGTVYEGGEVQQTDAAFFSEQVWATVELAPSEAAPEVTFHLRGPSDKVRSALDPALAERRPDEATVTLSEPPTAVREYLEEVDLLATHTAVFDPRLE